MAYITFLLQLVLATSVSASSISKLIAATQSGEIELIAQIIKQIPINSRDDKARTAVHHAVINKQPAVLEFLSANGADLNLLDADGNSPLDLLTQDKNYDLLSLEILIDAGGLYAEDIIEKMAQADASSTAGIALAKRNSAMLFKAAEDGDLETIELLLQAGTDPKVKNFAGEFPFHVAERNKHFVCCAILLEAIDGINGRDNRSWSPLHWAILAKDWDLVRKLMRNGAQLRYRVSSDSWPRQDAYDIAELTRQTDLFIKTVFAEQKQDIVYDLMQKASRQGRLDLYQKLLRSGVNLQDTDTAEKAAEFAFSHSDLRAQKTVSFLLANNINKSTLATKLSSDTALRSNKIMQQLLEYGVDPNSKNKFGYTPLITAVRKAEIRPEIITMLLKHGANPNKRGGDGAPPLIHLAERASTYRNYRLDGGNYLEFMKILLEHGADRNAEHKGKIALDILQQALEKGTEEYETSYYKGDVILNNLETLRNMIALLE